MSIKLRKETEKYVLDSIKRSVAENMDADIGDLKAWMFLEFFLKEIGPSIYNQAIADAQSYFQEKTADLAGSRYKAEFDYWNDDSPAVQSGATDAIPAHPARNGRDGRSTQSGSQSPPFVRLLDLPISSMA